MDFEEGLQIADEAVFQRIGRRLSPVEVMVLQGCWQDQTYDQIADTSAYSISYLNRTVAPKLWQTLSDSLGEKTGKKNLRFVLERYLKQQSSQASAPVSVPPHALASGSIAAISPTSAQSLEGAPRMDWGDAMDVSVFYGRQSDLERLTQWINGECCRLVVLLGMGGIGKTTLAIKWARQFGEPFQSIIWRSLRNAPPLSTLLTELITLLNPALLTDPLPAVQPGTSPTIGQLLQCLRRSRCLILLDALENLLEPGGVGQFRSGYEDYGELLRLVGETGHQSCVLVTSREQLADVSVLEGMESAVRSLRLEGSPEAVEAIVQDKGLVGTEAQKQQLGNLYGNSPLALKIVATSIQELFEGNIESFLSEDTLLFNGIRRLLNQHFSRLSPLEQSILYWLAINREWTTLNELQMDMIPPVSKARLLEALEALSLRSLIERQTNRYTLQPAIMEYVVEQFTERLVDELKARKLSLFLHHAILKATADEKIRLNQQIFVLKNIANQLSKQFGSLAALEQEILQILTQLRRSADQSAGYGAGNLLNLMHQLGLDLANYNFSNLTVWQADLRTAMLPQVDFTEADLTHTVFAEKLGSDRRYEGMNITGATGLTEAQKKILKQMGAIELSN